jgi:TolB-like protein
MRLLSAFVVALVCGSALGADPPAVRGDKVLILPLTPVGEAARSDWIGHAVQQSLATEITSKGLGVQAVAPSTQPAPAGDLDAAKAAAQKEGAGKVVFGSFQIMEGELRLTGQVYDLVEAKYVGSLKATGALRDLFSLEDLLGSQLRKLLAPKDAKVAPPAPGVAVAPKGPVDARPAEPPVLDRLRSQDRYRFDPGYSYYSTYGYYYTRPPCYYPPPWSSTGPPIIIIYPPAPKPPRSGPVRHPG